METLQSNPRLVKFLSVFTIIVSAFFTIKILTLVKEYKFIGSGTTATNVIQVAGLGEVFAVPDIAEVSFSVNKDAKTMAEAQKFVTDITTKATDYLKSQGVEEKDIKTQNYNGTPKYEWQTTASMPCIVDRPCPPSGGKNVMVGYTVNETIIVKIRKADNAGTIVAGLGKLGITDISGPNFTIDNDEALKADARSKAIADAKIKANELAGELGVKLVRIVNFNENTGGNYPMPYAKTMMMDSVGASVPEAANIPKGENKYTSNVTITYEIR